MLAAVPFVADDLLSGLFAFCRHIDRSFQRFGYGDPIFLCHSISSDQTRAEKKNFLSARHSTDSLLSDHTEKLCRRQYGNAERLRLGELTAGIFAADQVVGILGYGASGFRTQRLYLRVDAVTGVRLDLARNHKRFPHKGVVLYDGHSGFFLFNVYHRL